MESISSNHYSADTQASDALDWLRVNHPTVYSEVRKNFAEPIQWEGSWFDTDAMGVDQEWGSWLVDAIEETGLVMWIDGEPYVNVSDADVAEMEGM